MPSLNDLLIIKERGVAMILVHYCSVTNQSLHFLSVSHALSVPIHVYKSGGSPALKVLSVQVFPHLHEFICAAALVTLISTLEKLALTSNRKDDMKSTTMPMVTAPTVSAVSIKLPSLWTRNVESCFMQVEVQFSLRDIRLKETRYWYVVAALNAATRVRIMPSLPSLPLRNSYTKLKWLLIKTYGLTKEQRAHQFFAITDLGDHQPSEVMDEMLKLHRSEEPNFLLRYAFKHLLSPFI